MELQYFFKKKEILEAGRIILRCVQQWFLQILSLFFILMSSHFKVMVIDSI